MSQSTYTFTYIPSPTANTRTGQQNFLKTFFSIKKLFWLKRFNCVVSACMKCNKNSPIQAARTMGPASKHLSYRSAATADPAMLSQKQTRGNHTLQEGFGTYCQDEENRPDKGPDDIGLNVQPAAAVCHVLVKGSRKGHSHDNGWKACNTHTKGNQNPGKAGMTQADRLCSRQLLQTPCDQTRCSMRQLSLLNPMCNINLLQPKSVPALQDQIYVLSASCS